MECTNGFVRRCVEIEPEFPGEMPDELWKELCDMVKENDKQGMNKFLRHVVKQTKKGILTRIDKGIITI